MSFIRQYLLLFLLAIFASYSFMQSTAIILDLFSFRDAQENLVWLLVWGNWICSILYSFSFYRVYHRHESADKPLFIAESILLMSLLYLGTFAYFNGQFIPHTVGNTLIRLSLTFGIHYFIRKKEGVSFFLG